MKSKLAAHSIALICGMALLSGCGSQSRRVGSYTPVFSTAGLEQDRSELPSLVYLRPGAPGFDAYKRFIVDPVRVVYDEEPKGGDPKNLASLKTYFQEQLKGELRKSGYTIVTAPGPKTLRISPAISNVTIPGGAANAANIGLMALAPITPSVGGVTVETAFIESETDRIDAVAVDRSEGSRVLNASAWSTEADVKSAFRQWARGIRKAVDEAHGR